MGKKSLAYFPNILFGEKGESANNPPVPKENDRNIKITQYSVMVLSMFGYEYGDN
jgi:hypothetical protein